MKTPINDGYRLNTAQDGLSLRDYFAAKAMAALIIADMINVQGTELTADSHGFTALQAYEMADEMLKARAGK